MQHLRMGKENITLDFNLTAQVQQKAGRGKKPWTYPGEVSQTMFPPQHFVQVLHARRETGQEAINVITGHIAFCEGPL